MRISVRFAVASWQDTPARPANLRGTRKGRPVGSRACLPFSPRRRIPSPVSGIDAGIGPGMGQGGQSVPFTFTFPDAAGLCPPDREMEAFLPLAGRNAVVSGQGNSNVRLVRHGCTGHPDSIQPDSGRFFLQQGASSDWRFSGRLSAAFSCTRQQLCVLTVEARRDSFHSGLSGMNGSQWAAATPFPAESS